MQYENKILIPAAVAMLAAVGLTATKVSAAGNPTAANPAAPARGRMLQRITAVLTPEQQAPFDELKQKNHPLMRALQQNQNL